MHNSFLHQWRAECTVYRVDDRNREQSSHSPGAQPAANIVDQDESADTHEDVDDDERPVVADAKPAEAAKPAEGEKPAEAKPADEKKPE